MIDSGLELEAERESLLDNFENGLGKAGMTIGVALASVFLLLLIGLTLIVVQRS